eukprot:CAMPEP_0180273138 /NCGR_PEP_ID=MMETSP0988-20121125/4634_1 /TAXON_ID=697907 /ORGANISM="non described non described, Strain CCMP2293" /LENGTH=71 /DNA_ID=CAMNT_0022244287 /DNA_START=60 /DNA_END=275 /DNA_ORIENTATION=-
MWVRVINSAAGRRASWRAVGLIPRLRNGRLGLRVDAHDVGAELAVASRGGVGLLGELEGAQLLVEVLELHR